MVTAKAAFEELCSVIGWIDARSDIVNYPGEPVRMIAGACLDMALEHQAAIAELAGKELYGSASALLRASIEAYVRGVWFWRCATKKEIRRFETRDKIDKEFGQLVEEIERKLGSKQTVLSRMKSLHWKALCSFAHTGYHQVTRRYTAGLLKPNYTEQDRVQTLEFATAVGLLAAAELAALSNSRADELAVLERMKEYVAAKRSRRSQA
jgi:hypothetical protein